MLMIAAPKIKRAFIREAAPAQQEATRVVYDGTAEVKTGTPEFNRVMDEAQRYSVIDSVINAVSGQGTRRDSATALDFIFTGYLPKSTLEAMYTGSHIARKSVDIIPEDVGKNGWLPIIRGSNRSREEIKSVCDAIEERFEELDLTRKIINGIKSARLYGGSTLYTVIDNGISVDVSSPMPPLERLSKGCLVNVVQLDRWWVNVQGQYDYNLNSNNYGYPSHYSVVTPHTQNYETSKLDSQPVNSGSIHWTRMLRFDGAWLPFYLRLANQGWHQSILDKMSHPLKGHQSLLQALQTLMQKTHSPVYKMKDFANSIHSKGVFDEMKARISYANATTGIFNMPIMDMEDDLRIDNYDFAGIDNLLSAWRIEISASSDVPESILWGGSPGGLNATGKGEAVTYYDRIRAEQAAIKKKIRYLYQLISVDLFGKVQEGLDVHFHTVHISSPLEEATKMQQEANALTQLVNLGVINRENAALYLQQKQGNALRISDEMIDGLGKTDGLVPVSAEAAKVKADQETENKNQKEINV